MLFSRVASGLVCASGFILTAATPVEPVAALAPAYRVRNAPGMSDADTVMAISRALSRAAVLRSDTLLKDTTSLSKAWNNAILYKHEFKEEKNGDGGNLSASIQVSISCKTCYAKTTMTAQVSFASDFNISKAIQNVTSQVEDTVETLAADALKLVETAVGDVVDLAEDIVGLGDNNTDFQFPTLPTPFDINMPSIPGLSLQLTFDALELYVELEAALSAKATYELNLFTSKSDAGIKINDELLLGIVVVADLIIDAHAEIDISSGFHLKMNDGLTFDLEMFSKDVSKINFPGGKFEFLPVTIATDGAVLSATLRLGVHAGISFKPPTGFGTLAKKFKLGAGIEGSVFANVATFVTNVTAAPVSIGSRADKKCDLELVEYYEFAIGGAVGASIAVADKIWGATPNTTTAIFYTTLADLCATRSTKATTTSASTTSAAKRLGRQNLVTTTISTVDVFVGQACSVAGLTNCPASLQQTTTFPSTRTLVTAVPPGVTPTFPPTTFDAVSSLKDFGSDIKDIASSAGIPTSFTPPPDITSIIPDITKIIPEATQAIGDAVHAAETWLDGSTGGVSNKVILGVSVGVGVPIIIGLISLVCCLCRRRKYSAVPKSEGVTNIYMTGPPGAPVTQPLMAPEPYDPHKGSHVDVSVTGR